MMKKEFFSIEEAVCEWTLNHPDKTVKDYLMSVRSCSLSRYKYLINKYPLAHWNSLRGTLIWEKQEKLLDKMTLEKMWYMDHASKAIHLSTMQVLKALTKLSVEDPRFSRKVLDCSMVLEKNQTILMDMKSLAESVSKKLESEKKPTEKPSDIPVCCPSSIDTVNGLV